MKKSLQISNLKDFGSSSFLFRTSTLFFWLKTDLWVHQWLIENILHHFTRLHKWLIKKFEIVTSKVALRSFHKIVKYAKMANFRNEYFNVFKKYLLNFLLCFERTFDLGLPFYRLKFTDAKHLFRRFKVCPFWLSCKTNFFIFHPNKLSSTPMNSWQNFRAFW